MTLDERFVAVVERLGLEYPETPSLLTYRSAWELLTSVILSAQTTDEQVNAVTPALFARFPDAASLAGADQGEVEQLVHATGFFRTKARNIIGCARAIVDRHGGEVPLSMEALTALPGVGRKSAGVVRSHIADLPSIIVDTHFGRVVRRLGFSGNTDPVKLERDVAALLSQHLWNDASMRLNYHGRRYCHARSPACDRCPVADVCPSANLG